MTDSDLEGILKKALAVLTVILLVFGVWVLRHSHTPTAADKLGFVALAQIPDFSLVNEQGVTFHSTSLRGKVWAAAFIYTRCGTSCPLITYQMSQLQKRWSKEPDFRLVSITVDPLHDNPAALLNYARAYHANLGTWSFLTGPPETVYTLIEKGFLASVHRMSVEEKGRTVDIPHTTDVMVVDRQGKLRGVFEGVLESDWPRLDTAVGALLKERPEP